MLRRCRDWYRRLFSSWSWSWSRCSFGLFLGRSSSSRAGRSGRLILLHEVTWEDAFLLDPGVVDVFSAIPIGVLLVRDGYDCADGELQVILVRRRVVVDGLDLEGHVDDAAGARVSSLPSDVEDAGVFLGGQRASQHAQRVVKCRAGKRRKSWNNVKGQNSRWKSGWRDLEKR